MRPRAAEEERRNKRECRRQDQSFVHQRSCSKKRLQLTK
jgi:hypothetical protein